MKHLQIQTSPVHLDLAKYSMTGEGIQNQKRTLKDLEGIFADHQAWRNMDPETLAYTVQAHFPVAEGTEGGLFFGTTNLMPGKVGNEYFMTKGHFHQKSDRGEYYWGVQGSGMLLLMSRDRRTWAQEMYPGSLHYIPAHTAHRVANTGSEVLIFGACWPADAGHDYEEIARNGFSARLVEINGVPELIDANE